MVDTLITAFLDIPNDKHYVILKFVLPSMPWGHWASQNKKSLWTVNCSQSVWTLERQKFLWVEGGHNGSDIALPAPLPALPTPTAVTELFPCQKMPNYYDFKGWGLNLGKKFCWTECPRCLITMRISSRGSATPWPLQWSGLMLSYLNKCTAKQ